MVGALIEDVIRALLAARGPGKTICPSEVARVMAGDGDFRPHMHEVRGVAAAMADRGELVVTQKGEPVDPRSARGPVRLGRPDAMSGCSWRDGRRGRAR